MAVLDETNVIPQFTTGGADLLGLYALRNVTTGDTIDLATLPGKPSFQFINRGVVLGVSDDIELAAAYAGTVVTMPAGLSSSSGYLLVWGC